jgi:hypothetical protein
MQAILAVKARVTRGGHWDVWAALVDMARGMPLGDAAERQGVQARVLQSSVALVMRWHSHEREIALGFWKPMQPDCGKD